MLKELKIITLTESNQIVVMESKNSSYPAFLNPPDPGSVPDAGTEPNPGTDPDQVPSNQIPKKNLLLLRLVSLALTIAIIIFIVLIIHKLK